MLGHLRTAISLLLAAVVLCAFAGSPTHPSSERQRVQGFGLLVGDVKPCSAKQFDAQGAASPLIVILTKNGKTFDTYDVSADPGTTWYHFDVPAGRYRLDTTWPNSKDVNVVIVVGKTSKVDVTVSCRPAVI